MSEIERRTGRSNLNATMKTQLFSMLKGVMDEDDNEEEQDEFQIFDQEDTDEEDQAATEANTTLMTQCEFERDTHDKFQTTKGLKPSTIMDTQNTFFNQTELSRKTARKFQTISPNSINDCIDEEPLFSASNLFSLNQISSVAPPFLPQVNPRINWNPITSTKTFNFKTAQQKQSGANKSCFYFNTNAQQCNQYQQMLYQNLQPKTLNENMLFFKLENILDNAEEIDEALYMKFKGKFIHLIKNQQSSRILQYLLDKTHREIIHSLFLEISADEQLSNLLYDPYANYFLLKIFYFLNEEDRMAFLTQISKDFDNLCVNKISTYPIQCIVEHLLSYKEKTVILDPLLKNLMKVALDVYGTHVIEKILVCFEYCLIKPISSFILDNFLFLASNANGLCIVKKEIILEYKKDYFPLLKEQLEKHALILIQNPYGNYALQMVIDNWLYEDIEPLLLQFVDKCSTLSIQKFSSNVIEKCLQKSEPFLCSFIREVCLNKSALTLLMTNNFGQYVLQTALKCSRFKSKVCLLSALTANLDQLPEKKVLCKWKTIISAYSIMNSN